MRVEASNRFASLSQLTFSGLAKAPVQKPASDLFVRFGGDTQKPKHKKTIAILPHTHWDREWYEPFATFAMRQRDVMGDVTKRLQTGELPAFNFDAQVRAYQDYMNSLNREIASLEKANGDRDLLKALRTERTQSLQQVRDGKLAIGPWYIQPDLFLPSGESMIRNLKRGIQMARTQYKVPDYRVGYLPDPFGQPASMPTLLSGFGIDNMVFWRGGRAQHTDSLWSAKDGSQIITRQFKGDWGYSTREPLLDSLSDDEKEAAAVKLVNSTKDLSPATDLVLFPVGGDHMGAIQTGNLAFLTGVLQKHYPDYDVRVMTYPGFREEVRTRLQGQKDELEDISGHQLNNHGPGSGNILQGVYSARMDIKQANRRLETNLQHAEFVTALNRMLVAGGVADHIARGQLDEAEEMLLLNQPHDSICGCSDDMVHRENLVRNDIGMTKTQDVRENQLATIGENLATPNQWVIVNNSGRPYTGPVQVREWQRPKLNVFQHDQQTFFEKILPDFAKANPSATQQVTDETFSFENENNRTRTTNPDNVIYDLYRTGYVWVDNVPPFGIKVVEKNTTPEFTPTTADAKKLKLANGLVTLKINPQDGSIRVKDKSTGQVYNNLHVISDQDEQGDSYTAAQVAGSKARGSKVTGVKLIEDGPIRSTFEITYKLKSKDKTPMEVVTRVSLEAGNPQVQFETSYTNTYADHKLQVAFDTGKPVSEVRAEGHFGIESRTFDPGYSQLATDIYPAVDPQRGGHRRELNTNSGAIQRFIQVNGQMFLTEGMTEYEVSQNSMKLTLLRAFGFLSLPNTGVRDDAAGPHMETPEGQMIGKPITLRYAWQPSPKTEADAYHTADVFYGAVSGEQGRSEVATGDQASNSLVNWNNDSVRASAVRESDNGKGLLVRLINTTGNPQTVQLQSGFDHQRIQRLDFSERVQATLKKDTPVTIKPYGVETLLLSK